MSASRQSESQSGSTSSLFLYLVFNATSTEKQFHRGRLSGKASETALIRWTVQDTPNQKLVSSEKKAVRALSHDSSTRLSYSLVVCKGFIFMAGEGVLHPVALHIRYGKVFPHLCFQTLQVFSDVAGHGVGGSCISSFTGNSDRFSNKF